MVNLFDLAMDPWQGRPERKRPSSVKEVAVVNFRSIEKVCIDVTDMTLLFGTNGSGKSNLMRALMFAAANLSPKLNFGQTVYKFKNSVDLGAFETMVRDGDINKAVVIAFRFAGKFSFPSQEDYDSSKWKLFESAGLNQPNSKLQTQYFDCELHFQFEADELNRNLRSIAVFDNISNVSFEYIRELDSCPVSYDENEEKKYWGLEDSEEDELLSNFVFSEMDYIMNLEDRSELRFYLLDYIWTPDPHTNALQRFSYSWDYDFHALDRKLRESYRIKLKKDDETRALHFEEIDNYNQVFYQLHKFSFMTNIVLPQHLNEFFEYVHMPTTREIPNKLYVMSGNTFDEDQYYGIPKSFYNNLFDEDTKGHYEPITKSLNSFGFDYKLDFKVTDDIARILISQGDKSLNISYLSSGFIQLFPIIMFCKWPPLMKSFRTLLIEQPELHLHPKLQSQLAVLFSSVPRMLFIETHSEHLIRKLQVLIAKGELAREKVGVWYFKKDKNGVTKVEKMEIDENGLFKKDWPDGFFDDSIELTMELFEAVRKRKN